MSLALKAYEILASLAVGAAYPALGLCALLKGKDWRERLSIDLPRGSLNTDVTIWCHAASMGETESLVPVVEEIARRHPTLRIHISTTTTAGRELARSRVSGGDPYLLPLDVPWMMGRVVDRVRPKAIVLAETELWPALVAACERRAIPLAMVNGRISPGGFRGYQLIRPLTRRMLSAFSLLAMQSEDDRNRILRLGAPEHLTRVTGNAKADAIPPLRGPEERDKCLEEWGIPARARVIVAGSVRPREVAPILESFIRVRHMVPDLRLLLAPRHREKVPELERELSQRGLAWLKRSVQLSEPRGRGRSEWSILVLDTWGELKDAYFLGDVAFVGGTLDPRYGGHNPLEPALRGRPVIIGPYHVSCEESARRILAYGGGVEVRGEDDLARAAQELLLDTERRDAMGRAARRAALSLQGCASRTVDLLEEFVFAW